MSEGLNKEFVEMFEELHGVKPEGENQPGYMGDVFVMGAHNPGIDSVASAVALANLKNAVDSTHHYIPALSGEMDKVASFCVDKFGVEVPRVLDGVTADDKMIVVAYNSADSAVNGVESAEVLELVDNHALGSFRSSGPLYVRMEPRGATASIVFSMYKEEEEGLPAGIAGLLCAAIIFETDLFKSESTTQFDKIAAMELAIAAGVDLAGFSEEIFGLD